MRTDKTRQALSPAGNCFSVGSLAALLLALCPLLAGCGKEKESHSTAAVAVAKSAVEVKASSEGLIVHTPSAEFTLIPSGALSAALLKDGDKFTLEDKASAVGQTISLSKAGYSALLLDTAKAEVSEAVGKLGRLGKHINVAGKFSGTDLEETLTLEVYDAFPNIALLSVRVSAVTLQHHSFVAGNDPANPSHVLWTFQGSSLEWGKDEIFAMPAEFSRDNPFGAPVAVKDDLG